MQRKGVGHRGAVRHARACACWWSDVKDCYAALGLVHHLWTPIPHEFDDYIAKPKAERLPLAAHRGDRARGKALEVQIRTHEMHQHSELGVAAHWRYKEDVARTIASFDDKIAWLRQVLDWKDEVADARRAGRALQDRAVRRHASTC